MWRRSSTRSATTWSAGCARTPSAGCSWCTIRRSTPWWRMTIRAPPLSGPCTRSAATRTSSTRTPGGYSGPKPSCCFPRRTSMRTAPIRTRSSTSHSSSIRRDTSRRRKCSCSSSATARISTSSRWMPTSGPTPITRCRRTRRSASSSRTCTRRACGCAWRRSGARRSRPSTAPATTTTGCGSTSTRTTPRRCCRKERSCT